LPMAWAMVQYMMCEQPGPDDSCGQCASCYKIHSLQHPDVQWSFPVVTKKSGEKPISEDFYTAFRAAIKQNAYISPTEWVSTIDTENKQGNITARECRSLVQKLSQSAMTAPHKVLLMWQPEALGNEGNILLKLIEEPPPDTIIILATEDIDKILATIQSRTQLIALQPLSVADIQSALEQTVQLEPAAALNIARLCEGNFSNALELAFTSEEHNKDAAYFALLKQMLNAVFANNGSVAVVFAEDFAKLKTCTRVFFTHIRALLTRQQWHGRAPTFAARRSPSCRKTSTIKA
jgi:DNA polymerase III subunit delta'